MEGVQSFHWMAGTAKTTVPSGATFIPFWQQHLYSDSLAISPETTGSPSYGKRHIKECTWNFKLSPKCPEMQSNSSFCSTYLCGGDSLCFWGVWGRFSRDLRHRAKNWLHSYRRKLPRHTRNSLRKQPPVRRLFSQATQEITTTQESWAGWTILLHFRTFWGQFKFPIHSFIWRFP